jgi:hypothetical protein
MRWGKGGWLTAAHGGLLRGCSSAKGAQTAWLRPGRVWHQANREHGTLGLDSGQGRIGRGRPWREGCRGQTCQPQPLGQTIGTDTTADTTLGKWSRRGSRGDFATSASPSVTRHPPCPRVSHVRLRQWPRALCMLALIDTLLTLGFAGPTPLPWL